MLVSKKGMCFNSDLAYFGGILSSRHMHYFLQYCHIFSLICKGLLKDAICW